jgi:hypothetical protein
VINGLVHALGSDRAAIERAIAKSRAQANTMTLSVEASEADGRITITLPDMASSATGEVWLCGVKNAAPVEIARGENRGKTVTYHNVVRGWHKLGQWTGRAMSLTLSRSALKGDVDEAAVIVQERPNGYPGRVLGASTVALK